MERQRTLRRAPQRPPARPVTHPLSSPAPRRDRRAETRAMNDGLDPDLRAYLRAPYDPLNGAQATRFVARVLLEAAPRHGWMRPFALAVALLSLIGLVGTAMVIVGLFRDGSAERAVFFGLQALIVTGPVGAFGAVLLWRVLRGRAPHDARAA